MLKHKEIGRKVCNVLPGSAIFWKLDFFVWKWSTPIWQVGTRAIVSAKTHGNRKALADIGGAWKWTSKPGKKTDTHPLHIQDPHVKTRVHHSTPRTLRICAHTPTISTHHYLLCLYLFETKPHMHHRFPTKLHTTCPWRCKRFKMRLCLTSDWSGVCCLVSTSLATSGRHGRSSSAGKPKACNLSNILSEWWVLQTFLDATKTALNLLKLLMQCTQSKNNETRLIYK